MIARAILTIAARLEYRRRRIGTGIPARRGPVRLALLLLSVAAATLASIPAADPSPGALRSLLFERPAGLPPGRLPFRTYGTDVGLNNFAVRRIVQDTSGFIWAGTEDGLYRYDGDRFARFDFRHGLPSTWITDLIATPEGELLVCTPQGLAISRGERFEAASGITGAIGPGACNAVTRDLSGTVWVAHQDGLFYRKGSRFMPLSGGPAAAATAVCSLPPPDTGILAGIGGEIATVAEGAVRSRVPLAEGWREPVDSIAVDSGGTVWVQSARRLFRIEAGSAAPIAENGALPPVSSRGVLSTDRAGRLWVPTDEGVSCRVDGGWRHIRSADGLPTDWARYVFEDREGSLWIASLGVHRLIGRGGWLSWTRAAGLPSDTIWDIHRSRSGDLWVATDKGLCLATPTGWKVLPGTERTVVRRLHEDRLGRFWLGLVPSAILLYEPVSGTIARFGAAEGVAGRRVLCLEEDREGRLWAATDGAGLLRYDPQQRKFIREDVPGGTAWETFRFLLRDRRGRMVATGENGLLVQAGSRWRRFTQKDGLLRDHVSYVAETARGDLWISYFEPLGVIRAHIEGDRLEILDHIDTSRGLSPEKVYLLGEDSSGKLWVGTGKGVNVFSEDSVVHLSQGDGLAGDDIDAMAFLGEADGSVFIGTSSGLSLNRDEQGRNRPSVPVPVLLNGMLGNRPLDTRERRAAAVSHRDNIFRLRFASLSFLNEQQLEYEVKLSRVDGEWRRVRTGDVFYPGLAPGAYEFEARARAGPGAWSKPAAYSFEILTPWWNSWPARLGILLLASGAIGAAVQWRVRRLRQKTRALEQLVAERTQALAAANAALERLTVTDPLTGLKNRRFLELAIPGEIAQARRSMAHSKTPGGGAAGARPPELVILIVDLDHFKRVNDQFGHAAGDRALRRAGAVLISAVRESDTVVRWGGEEFLILARGSSIQDAPALAERIRSDMEATPFDLGGDPDAECVTCSVGFASWPFSDSGAPGLDWEAAVKLADRCLYAVKRSGRNGWAGVRPGGEAGTLRAEDLADLPAAAAAGKLDLISRLQDGFALRWD